MLSLVAITIVGAAVASNGSASGANRNGRAIVFTRLFSPPRGQQIYFVDSEGRGARQLRTRVKSCSEPEWSPDGRWILFRGGRDLYLIRPDGAELRRLTDTRAGEQSAAWSPDGARIVYQRSVPGPGAPTAIWMLTLKGGKVERLTRDALGAHSPSWSPDGSRIVFVSQNSKHGYGLELWMMNADGSDQHRVFPALRDASGPVWAPTGYRLLFTDGNRLYVMDALRGHPRALVTLTANAYGEREQPSPEWSPDGSKIVFNQLNRYGRSEIWVVNADGTNLRRLTTPPSGVIHDSDPSWQPLATARS